MRIKEVSATCRRLIALPKFENVLYEATMTAEVEEGEDASRVYDTVLQLCKDKVAKELSRFEDLSAIQSKTKRIG